MTFKTSDVRLDHWRKTNKVRTAKGGAVTRDAADMPDPAGEKFRKEHLYGITNYVRIDHPSKGSVICRRKVRVHKPIGK